MYLYILFVQTNQRKHIGTGWNWLPFLEFVNLEFKIKYFSKNFSETKTIYGILAILCEFDVVKQQIV